MSKSTQAKEKKHVGFIIWSAVIFFLLCFLGYADGDSVYNPYISPVYAEYEGMPPMLIQTGTPEMLLSDSTTVAEKADAAGVDVTLKLYPGMWHTFYTAMQQTREQKEAWNTIADFLR